MLIHMTRRMVSSALAAAVLTLLAACSTSPRGEPGEDVSIVERIFGESARSQSVLGISHTLNDCEELLPHGSPTSNDDLTHRFCNFGQDRSGAIGSEPALAVEYNARTLTPSWVAYSLTSKKITRIDANAALHEKDPDKLDRRGFIIDQENGELLKRLGIRVVENDYTSSGWDRGHLAPSASMTWGVLPWTASYYMTNIAPQDAIQNQRAWKCLEDAIRQWARTEGDTFVVVGTLYIDGGFDHFEGNDGRRIVPPSHFYAVAYQPSRQKAVAMISDNTQVCRSDEAGLECKRAEAWKDVDLVDYLYPVATLEEFAGIGFFPEMSEAERMEIDDFDESDWPLPHLTRGELRAKCRWN